MNRIHPLLLAHSQTKSKTLTQQTTTKQTRSEVHFVLGAVWGDENYMQQIHVQGQWGCKRFCDQFCSHGERTKDGCTEKEMPEMGLEG